MTHWFKQRPIQGIWLILISYGCGIVLAAENPASHQLLNQSSILCSILFVLLFITIKAHHISLWPTIVTLCIAMGFSAYAVTIRPPSSTTNLDHYTTNNQTTTITGIVRRIEPQQGRWRMDIDLEKITDKTYSTLATGRVRVQVGRLPKKGQTIAPRRQDILPGDRIIFRAKLRKPRQYGLPAEFNYPRHLARSRIYTTAFINNQQSIIRLPYTIKPSLTYRLERWRTILGDQISTLFSPQSSAYILSLTLGQKSRFTSAQREQLAFVGISHLFSISGLHLGLIAGLIYFALNTIYRTSERLMLMMPAQIAVPLLTLLPLIFYLLLSGGALPTIRAILLMVLGIAALISQRATPPLALLAAVATAILAFDPLAIFSASFQLSFSGVAALIYCLTQPEEKSHSGLKRWLVGPLIATVIATIATSPIALWHFHTFAPASILCNLIAIPLIGIVAVPLALLATLLLPLHPHTAESIFNISLWLIETTLDLSSRIAQGPLTGQFIYLSPEQHGAIILLALAILTLIAKKLRNSLLFVIAGMLTLCAPTLYSATAPLEVTPLSIGQGESILLRLGKEKTYLIDGGGFYSQSFDVGKQLVAPALAHLGATHLDAVILSHDHPDHRKGLIHVLRHFKVEQFWSSIPINQLHWSLQKVLQEKDIPTRLFTSSWTNIPLDDAAQLDIFVPPDDTAKMNDRSLVILARYMKDGILLTGDLEYYGVTQLLNGSTFSTVTALKLPHHGSRRSRPHALIQATRPNIAISSVGFNNSYHFPHSETLAALEENQTALIRTDRDGTVQLNSWGHGWHQQVLAQP